MKSFIGKMVAMVAMAAAVVACSKDEVPAQSGGVDVPTSGVVNFACGVDSNVGNVITRAGETKTLPLPADLWDATNQTLIPSAVDLYIDGDYEVYESKNANSSKEWSQRGKTFDAKLSLYTGEQCKWDAGDGDYTYVATLSYGGATMTTSSGATLLVEGAGKPYYKGSVTSRRVVEKVDNGDNTYGEATAVSSYENPFTVDFYPNASTTLSVTMTLQNSCFDIKLGTGMDYYTSVELTVHTSVSNFTFKTADNTLSSAASAIYYINPEQVLSISGKAVKQNGSEVTFAKTEIGKVDANGNGDFSDEGDSDGVVAAKTHYAIEVSHSTAGKAGLTISFNDTYTGITESEVDLNEEGN